MALRVKGSHANPASKARATELAYKTLVASSQQRTFQNVLSQVQGTGKDSANSEINSLQAEMNKLQALQFPTAGIADSSPASRFPVPKDANGGVNALATSSLLQLAALSGKGDKLGDYCMKSMGLSGSGITRGQAGTGRGRAGALDGMNLSGGIGSLSAQFESGERGVDVIGYDRNGGTSYGTYQISSRAGTMRSFIEFLEDRAPEWAKRLRASGPSNTGSRRGSMPSEWKRIAAENPEKFAELQHDFIAQTHYIPAAQEIQEQTGVDIDKHSRALKEVLWSTAVQHGPRGASKIFCKAINRAKVKGTDPESADLINNVYSSRARQFGQSTVEVQGAVQGRFREEKAMALAMLANESSSSRFGA